MMATGSRADGLRGTDSNTSEQPPRAWYLPSVAPGRASAGQEADGGAGRGRLRSLRATAVRSSVSKGPA